MRLLARWCYRHRITVVLIWLAVLLGSMAIANSLGSSFSNSFSLPKAESTQAINLLRSVSPKNAGDREEIVFAVTPGHSIFDAGVRQSIARALGKVAHLPHVTAVVSPFSREGHGQISANHQIAYATVTLDRLEHQLTKTSAKTFVNAALTAHSERVNVAVAGPLAELANRASFGGTGIGVLLAGLVLLLVFGSIFAMALPLISALVSLGTAIFLVELISHVMAIPEFATQLVLLLGLGVGVDYALFIVTRHRQGLLAGLDPEESVVKAVNTSGRAVLFAGIIVCIALLGMFAIGVSLLYGLAISAAIGVALTMAAALTLLPALLGFIGKRILSPRQKRRLLAIERDEGDEAAKGFWLRWANLVMRRPVIPAVLATVFIIALAAPFFSLRLGSADQGNDPLGTTTRTAYDLLAKGFGPGFNGPLELVAVEQGAKDKAAISKVIAAVSQERGVAHVAPLIQIPTKDGSLVSVTAVYPSSSPQDIATQQLIDRLRSQTIPQALGASHFHVYVGGTTAIYSDFAANLTKQLPLFIGLVVLLSFLLLAVVFRSIVIPLVSAVMNLLSIGAAFGVIVAVFQWGWLGSWFGVNKAGPVEAFLPVMLFAILFGLSMDYQVFLVTRIHEEWLKHGKNELAVRNGIAGTGKTITAAALIMILVFGSFILGGERVIKEFGLGLAGGILVDAIVIRMCIVPAVMLLFGKSNWWFPKWLDRILPSIGLEEESEALESVSTH